MPQLQAQPLHLNESALTHPFSRRWQSSRSFQGLSASKLVCTPGTPWVVSINNKGIATITPVQPSTPKAG